MNTSAARMVDTHQHIWPPEFIKALRVRTDPPFMDGWKLHTKGEAPYDVDPATHDIEARGVREASLGVGLVGISISSPLGIEHLPAAEAEILIDAWHRGALSLGDPFRVWASPALKSDRPNLSEIVAEERVCGVQVPADALLTPPAVEKLAPVFEVAENFDKPILVHPGVAPRDIGTPSWWPALVPYIGQMQAAWYSWYVSGRLRHRNLRIAFAALAGLAPLNHERLLARSAEPFERDALVFYETSSFSTDGITAVARIVGESQIINGSDYPYAERIDPGISQAFTESYCVMAPRTFLGTM